MAEILRDTTITAPRLLEGPEAALDDATLAVLDAAVADAERRAYAAGHAAGHRDATEAVERATNAVSTRIDTFLSQLANHREALVEASFVLGRRAARAVLDDTPPAQAQQVLDRALDAVRHLDDDRLELRMHPDDAAVVGRGSVDQRLTIVDDPSIASGEARITGQYASLDLTRSALLDSAMDVLTGLPDEAGS